MRVPLCQKIFTPALVIPRWPGMVIGLMGSVWIVTPGAAEDSDQKVARLGFTFDVKAHEAAVAAASAAPADEAHEPTAPWEDLLHLPKYVVTGKRLAFQDRELLTPKGRLDLAKKTYLTPAYQKTFGPLSAIASLILNPLGGWQPNDPEAMALYEDAEQKRRNTEMKDLIKADELSDHSK